jgi:hypothetical protein
MLKISNRVDVLKAYELSKPYVPYCQFPGPVRDYLLPKQTKSTEPTFTFSSASAPEAKGNVVRSTRINYPL